MTKQTTISAHRRRHPTKKGVPFPVRKHTRDIKGSSRRTGQRPLRRPAKPTKTITFELWEGTFNGIEGLPEGWQYEVFPEDFEGRRELFEKEIDDSKMEWIKEYDGADAFKKIDPERYKYWRNRWMEGRKKEKSFVSEQHEEAEFRDFADSMMPFWMKHNKYDGHEAMDKIDRIGLNERWDEFTKNGPKPKDKTVQITMRDGVVWKVRGMPPGYGYDVKPLREHQDDPIRNGTLRQKHGLDTSTGSFYYQYRQEGLSDYEAQKRVFRKRGLID